ncbi:MAG: hypothetical protein CM15mP120_04530 [Pseudomonadota bacterium]|nr:MAG: hypothetical protein CM15mP120_04530 [Pseudomonadota bacterium]
MPRLFQAAAGSGVVLRRAVDPKRIAFNIHRLSSLRPIVKRLLVMTVLIVLPHGSVGLSLTTMNQSNRTPLNYASFSNNSPKAATYITTFLALYMWNRICSGPAKTASALI